MPIYEYECQKCGEQFEVTQKITATPLKRHNGASKCGGKVKKLMSSNAFHLKGTGWYKTDYASPQKDKKKEGEAKETKETKEVKDSGGTSASESGGKKEKSETKKAD